MGVAGQRAAAPTSRTGGGVQAQGEDKGEGQLDKRLALHDQLEEGGWVLEIHGDGAVVACRFGGLCHVSSPCRRWWVRMRHGVKVTCCNGKGSVGTSGRHH